MLIGLNPSAKKAAPAAQNARPDIFDATTADFETSVIRESMSRPVIVDFWAPWCGPCKQLGPMIESAVAAKGGKVALAKIDIDQNPELAQAFRVQSIPMVVAMYQGQPVGAFAGARPKADIDNLIDQLIKLQAQNQPEAIDIPAALKDAAGFLAAGDFMQAQQLYAAILSQDESNAQAYAGLVRVLIAAGETDQAQAMIDGAPDKISKSTEIAAVRTALELARSAPGESPEQIAARLTVDPANPELLFNHAEACFARGMKEQAVESLITLIRSNRAWEDEKGRKQLLKYFEAWGAADPASLAGRKRLSSVLFS